MTVEKYIVALDQGTTSSRAVVLDHDANIVAVSQREFPQIYPKAGWVEHDPMEIWASQSSTLVEVLAKADINSDQIAGIGITNQRETTIVWERDRQANLQRHRLAVPPHRRHLRSSSATGWKSTSVTTPARWLTRTSPAPKVKWIWTTSKAPASAPSAANCCSAPSIPAGVENDPGRVHVTDYTNASRTMMFNIHELDWDERMLEVLDIPRAMLPKVRPSSGVRPDQHRR